MPRFKVNHAYKTDQHGPWNEGDEVELTDEEAAHIEVDSPGCLSAAGDAGEGGDDGSGLDSLTVKQLKAHADEHGIDLGDARSKADILAAIEAASAAGDAGEGGDDGE